MLQPILTVIEGGNPDDQYSKTAAPQLKLVPPPAPTLNVTLKRSLGIRLIEGLISLLVNAAHSLEMFRVCLQRRAAVHEQHLDEPMTGRRGW